MRDRRATPSMILPEDSSSHGPENDRAQEHSSYFIASPVSEFATLPHKCRTDGEKNDHTYEHGSQPGTNPPLKYPHDDSAKNPPEKVDQNKGRGKLLGSPEQHYRQRKK